MLSNERLFWTRVSFYNGVENILKQILLQKGVSLPTGESWHRDLLQAAHAQANISESLFNYLKVYMAFRHFFSHAYMLDVEPQRMEPLVRNLLLTVNTLKTELADIN